MVTQSCMMTAFTPAITANIVVIVITRTDQKVDENVTPNRYHSFILTFSHSLHNDFNFLNLKNSYNSEHLRKFKRYYEKVAIATRICQISTSFL